MAESSKEGLPGKVGAPKELAEAPDLLHANSRHPRHRISKQSSAPG